MICPSCTTPNNEAARYCSNCGGELHSDVAAPSVIAYAAHANGAAAAPALTPDGDEITRVRSSVSPNAGATIGESPSAHRADAKTVTGDPLIGCTIEGKYRIDAKIGAGGMGSVYRAHRLMIGDDVAVKILHPEHVSQPDATERFRREAQAAARLKHPNAVSIYDFGVTSGGLVYLVMELVEGQSLREIIKRQGPLTPSAAADVISQVCAALDEAHRQHIVHRDLKPDNIVVQPMINGLRVKVLDFGIAKLRDLTAGNLTQTGSVMGTPHYMSPEQCLGEEIDSRSDLYSLGIVLYEMLAGVVPFNSPMSTAVVVQHVNQTPPPLRSMNVSISPAVETVVMRALAKQPGERPQTAAVFAQELSSAVAPPTAAPVAHQQATPPPTFAMPGSGLGHAGAISPAPTVVLRTPVSGSASYGGPTSPLTPPYTTHPQPVTSGKKPIALLAVSGTVLVLGALVGLYFVFFSFSAKKAVLAEVKKGNLVKPQGNSAYDLFLKHKGEDLKKEDIDEIAKEVAPQLEKRGDTIINNLKADAIESEDEWVEGTRLFTWLNELRANPAAESKIYFSQGSLAFLKKDFAGAISNYQRATKLQPNWSLALNRLGRAYYNQKDKSSAREFYRRATAAEPGWNLPWINLGALCNELQDYYAAETALRTAIQLEGQRPSPHAHLGFALQKMDRLCEGLSEYQTAMDAAANNPAAPADVETWKRQINALNTAIYTRAFVCY